MSAQHIYSQQAVEELRRREREWKAEVERLRQDLAMTERDRFYWAQKCADLRRDITEHAELCPEKRE